MTPYDDYDDDEAHWQQFGRQHAHSTSTQPPTVLDGLNRAGQGSAGRQVLASLVAKAAVVAFFRDLSGGSSFYGRQTQKETAPSAWSVAGRNCSPPFPGWLLSPTRSICRQSQPALSLFLYLPSLAGANCFLKI